MVVEALHQSSFRSITDEHQRRRELRVQASERDLVADASLQQLPHGEARDSARSKLHGAELVTDARNAARPHRGGHAVERTGDVETRGHHRGELFGRHFAREITKSGPSGTVFEPYG
jgi:hypothetical protein